MKTFGDFIKESREARGLSQRELGRLSGLSGAFISKLESNKTQRLSVNTLRNLSTALKMSFNYISSIYENKPVELSENARQ